MSTTRTRQDAAAVSPTSNVCTIANKRTITHPTGVLEGEPSVPALEFHLSTKTKENPTSPAWKFKVFRQSFALLGVSGTGSFHWTDNLP